jgi:hypothetical protein
MIHLLPRTYGAAVRDALLRDIDGDPAIRESAACGALRRR